MNKKNNSFISIKIQVYFQLVNKIKSKISIAKKEKLTQALHIDFGAFGKHIA